MDKKIDCHFEFDEVCKGICKMPIVNVKKFLVFSFLAVLMGIVFISLGIFDESLKTFFIICGVIVIVFGILGIILSIFSLPNMRLKFSYKKTCEANIMFKNGIDYNYYFYDDKFMINVISKDSKSNAVVNYKDLYKLVVGDDMIYFFISSNSAYLLKKDLLTNEELNYISSKLNNKAKKQYKIVK